MFFVQYVQRCATDQQTSHRRSARVLGVRKIPRLACVLFNRTAGFPWGRGKALFFVVTIVYSEEPLRSWRLVPLLVMFFHSLCMSLPFLALVVRFPSTVAALLSSPSLIMG